MDGEAIVLKAKNHLAYYGVPGVMGELVTNADPDMSVEERENSAKEIFDRFLLAQNWHRLGGEVLDALAVLDRPNDDYRRQKFDLLMKDSKAKALILAKEERKAELKRQQQAREAEQVEKAKLEAERIERERRELEALRKEEQRQLENKKRIEEERIARQERARAAREIAERKSQVIERIKVCLEKDFLNVDQILIEDPDSDLLQAEELESLKTECVKEWAGKFNEISLDEEQAKAVATTSGNVQVVARAGSGKTRTIVARALFLMQHCSVAPCELLVLAFNKDAAEEVKERIRSLLSGGLPHVMTFHALAYALVHPDGDILADDEDAGSMALSSEIQDAIDDLIRSEEGSGRVKSMMLDHFREDWERIVDGKFELGMEQFLKHKRSLPKETLGGEYVKSFGEKLIANTLFEHGIDYKYEPNFKWDGVNYRPDFTIRSRNGRGGVAIEYFGLEGTPDYDEQSDLKRRFWKEKKDWELLEYVPADILNGGADQFSNKLISDLGSLGLDAERLPEEEIWQRVRKRAIDRFTSAVKNFIGRVRKAGMSPEDLLNLISTHQPISKGEELFIEIGWELFISYLDRLSKTGRDDFDGLVWKAIDLVRRGKSGFVRDRGQERGDLRRLRFIMIDEFQDFSEMFNCLVEAVIGINESVRLFCVGDDWQAINSFAGSDLKYFREFESSRQEATKCWIRTNYRSDKAIVDVGNILMDGLGPEASSNKSESGWVRVAHLESVPLTTFEQQSHSGDIITPLVLRLIHRFLNQGMDVVLLNRRKTMTSYVSYSGEREYRSNNLVSFRRHICSYFAESERRRIRCSTVHRYKGRENDAAIILDVVEGSYPLISPSWFLLRIFGDSLGKLEEDERRLFYVALTRARSHLVFVTDIERRSPFLDQIQGKERIPSINWQEFPPMPRSDGCRIEVRVTDAYEVRDDLKRIGYTWDQETKSWWRVFFAEGFSVNSILKQNWAKTRVRIEITDEHGEILYPRVHDS